MLKKLINFFVIALLIFILAACNKPGQTETTTKEEDSGIKGKEAVTEEIVPEEGAELIVWGNGDKEGEWIKYVAEQYSKQFEVPVKFEEVGHTDAPGKLQIDGPAGLGGDVFMTASDHVGNMNSSGLLYTNYYASEYKDRFFEGANVGVSALDEEGELQMYGYPIAVETLAMVYNKDLLDKMNFKPAETMDELIAQSKEFMSQNPGTYGFMLEPGNFYGNYSFLGGYGGYIFGDNNTNPDDIGLNNEGVVKTGKLLERIRDEILPLKKEDLTGDVISSYFNEGKSLYTIEGSWGVNSRIDAGINLGVMVMPKLDNGEKPTPFLGVKALYVNAYSKYPKAATLFAKFATSDEMLLKRFDLTGELPPSKDMLENEKIKSDELKLPFLEQAQYAEPMPNIPEMQSVWGGMEVALAAIWNEDAEPKEALDIGVNQIKDAIATQSK